MHPEFERFALYIQQKFAENYDKDNHLIYPQREFMKAILAKELDNAIAFDSGLGNRYTIAGPGLWSSAGPGYKRHYEIIQDVFLYQAYNDHVNEMYHQPVFITREELGIDDEQWDKIRDSCWIQNEWSASITPKGAFFCEIAASLDMLFDGPGGWPIESGWWQREVKDFGDQLHWCEFCGIACDTFTRNANEEIDDVSPIIYEKLKTLDSPKLKAGKVNVLKFENSAISEESKATNKRFSASMPYTEGYEARFNAGKSELFPRGFVNIIVCESQNALDMYDLSYQQFEKTYALCRHENVFRALHEKYQGISEVEMLKIEKRLGITLNRLIWGMDDYYIFIHSEGVVPGGLFCESLKRCVLNPGVLHYIDFSNPVSRDTKYIQNADILTGGFAAVMHKNALSLKKIGFDGVANSDSFKEIADRWDLGKKVELSSEMDYITPETTVRPNIRYAIFGTGAVGSEALRQVRHGDAKLVCVVDSSPDKWGCDFHGIEINKPEYLRENIDSFDRVIIASQLYYYEMKQSALELGIPLDRINLVS